MFRRTCRYVHKAAVIGFDHANVERYNRGRPSYPLDAVQKVGDIIQTSVANFPTHAPMIVELGAGTGKFTASFLKGEKQFKAAWGFDRGNYLATEPSDAFRESLERLVCDIRLEKGFGDAIPTSDETASAVIVAQAFHWMATHETLNEVSRVLKRGGSFIMVWNALDRSIPWISQLERIQNRYYVPSTPRYITGEWEKCFQVESTTLLGFGNLKKWSTSTEFVVPESTIIDRVLSVSVVAALPDDEKAAVVDEIRQVLKANPETRDVNDDKFVLKYRTDIAWVCKKGCDDERGHCHA